MNPLDWSLIGGPLPVILMVGALLALAWLAAGRNAPGRGWLRRWLRRGGRGGGAGGAPSVRWLVVWVPLIVVAAAGVIALVTWLINNVWRPFPDLLPFSVVLWSWVALAGPLRAPRACWCWPPPPTRSTTASRRIRRCGRCWAPGWTPSQCSPGPCPSSRWRPGACRR